MMKTLRSSPLLPIFLIVAVDILGYTIILPLLPFYAERLGASPSVVGMLVAVYAVLPVDRGTDARTLVRSLRPQAAAGGQPDRNPCRIYCPRLRRNAVRSVFLSRIIDGLTAGNLSLAQAYISDVTPPKIARARSGLSGSRLGWAFRSGPQ